MKATALLPAVLLGILLAAGPARAQFYPPPPRQAPDTCNQPGFWNVNWCGLPYGPNYWLRPPFPPYNGLLPIPTGFANGAIPAYRDPNAARTGPLGLCQPGAGPGCMPSMGPGRQPPMPSARPGCQPLGFPTHPFAHGPRDFFMECDNKDDHH